MSGAPSPKAAIDHVCLTVPDLARAEAFYRDALCFASIRPATRCDPDRAALIGTVGAILHALTMRLGGQTLELMCFDPPGRPYPEDSTSSDLWFQHCAIVVRDMAAAFARLDGCGLQPITRGGPQTLPPETGAVAAYKFRDPFGHPLELLWFPAGVGDPLWHAPAKQNPAGQGAGFCSSFLQRDADFRGRAHESLLCATMLGIDHTAIAVSDAAASARFYERLLGFRTVARTANAGAAQSRLDDRPNDQVDVLALTASGAPPHLELLGYRDGLRRRPPADRRPADLAVTRTIVTARDWTAVNQRIEALDLAKTARRGTWDGRPAVALDDPDGHALIVRASA